MKARAKKLALVGAPGHKQTYLTSAFTTLFLCKVIEEFNWLAWIHGGVVWAGGFVV